MAGGTRPGANLSYGMQLNRYLAIEGSALLAPIVDTAYRTADGQEVSVGGFGFSARAFVPIGDSFSLHAKLGYTFPFSCIGTSYSFSPNGSNRPGGSYGLGFDIKPPELVTMRFGVERLPAGVFSNTTRITNYYFMLIIPMR